jgi:hypothetical protein
MIKEAEFPTKPIHEIADPILARWNVTIGQIRNGGGIKGGLRNQELTTPMHLIIVALRAEHWGYSAIARYIGRNHATVIAHCKRSFLNVMEDV